MFWHPLCGPRLPSCHGYRGRQKLYGRYVSLTQNAHHLLTDNTGLDLVDFATKFSEFSSEGSDVGRNAIALRRMAKPMQDSFTALEKVHIVAVWQC